MLKPVCGFISEHGIFYESEEKYIIQQEIERLHEEKEDFINTFRTRMTDESKGHPYINLYDKNQYFVEQVIRMFIYQTSVEEFNQIKNIMDIKSELENKYETIQE